MEPEIPTIQTDVAPPIAPAGDEQVKPPAPSLSDQVFAMQRDAFEFRKALTETFVRLDLNGDGEVAEDEVASLQSSGGSRLKPEFLKTLKDNFADIAQAHNASWFGDDKTIDIRDFETIADMQAAKREDELLAPGAQAFLSKHFKQLKGDNFGIEQGRIRPRNITNGDDNDSIYTTYVTSRFRAIVNLDSSSWTRIVPNFLMAIDQADIGEMTSQAMTDASLAKLYNRSMRLTSGEYYTHKVGLKSFIEQSSPLIH